MTPMPEDAPKGETVAATAEHRGPTSLRTDRWQAAILPGPPLIAPVRQFVFPQSVPGEEEALARGSLWVAIKPVGQGDFLAQCALGFASGSVAHGLWPSAHPDRLFVAAGGYVYALNAMAPEQTRLLPMRPVVTVLPAPALGLTVFAGYHTVLVVDDCRGLEVGGHLWESARLSWEGITLTGIQGAVLHGTGWDLATDQDLPFTLHLHTRALHGGGYRTGHA